MSDVTIKQLATVLNMAPDKLLKQLADAGMSFADSEEILNDEEKKKLLTFLRSSHASEVKAGGTAGSGRVTLKRRRQSSIKVTSGTGRKATSKTVNVEVRGKRTYVKRAAMENTAKARSEREEAQRRLEESRREREREAEELERRRRQREEKAQEEASTQDVAVEAEAAAAPVAPTEVVTPESETPTAAEPVATEAVATTAEPDAPAAEADTDTDETTTATTEEDVTEEDAEEARERAEEEAWNTPVMPQLHERRKRRPRKVEADEETAAVSKKAAAEPSKVRRHKPRQDDDDDKPRGKKRGGKLHLASEGRGKRRERRRQRAAEAAAEPSAHGFSRPTAPVVHEVPIGEANIVSDLAQKMAVKGAEVVKTLFKMGVMATINQTVDHDTAVLVVEEMGHKPVEEQVKNAESELLQRTRSAQEEGEKTQRPPVVTIMGHVDHGKTSLLDYIRRTKIAGDEAGGITQHIGAYHVQTDRGVITFLDTPGHAAFASMRARGARSTDIIVLVVAADDGVKPQTIEAIEHARAAEVPLVVAVNKIDKSSANVDNVKQGLATHEVIPEDWGGDTQFVELSAKTGQGVDALLEAISLQAEVMELKAVHDGNAAGTVIEARLERGRGPVATMLVQSGTLHKGDFVVCGVEYGRMRALTDASGKEVESAGPSIPVAVLGLSGVPASGDDFIVVADERLARQVAEEREQKLREKRLVGRANRLEDIMAQMKQAETQQTLNILVKADVHGTAEALREALSDIGNENVKVNVVRAGVGGINESDATLASTSQALLIGFNVRADASARKVVETNGVDLRYFSIIYDVIDQVKQAASGLLGTEIREEIIGTAEVKEVFRSSKFGAVAGSIVVDGVVKHSHPVRVLRDDTVIFEGELDSLRRFKDNVDEVHAGTECGIAVKHYDDVKPGDTIECYQRTEVARTL